MSDATKMSIRDRIRAMNSALNNEDQVQQTATGVRPISVAPSCSSLTDDKTRSDSPPPKQPIGHEDVTTDDAMRTTPRRPRVLDIWRQHEGKPPLSTDAARRTAPPAIQIQHPKLSSDTFSDLKSDLLTQFSTESGATIKLKPIRNRAYDDEEKKEVETYNIQSKDTTKVTSNLATPNRPAISTMKRGTLLKNILSPKSRQLKTFSNPLDNDVDVATEQQHEVSGHKSIPKETSMSDKDKIDEQDSLQCQTDEISRASDVEPERRISVIELWKAKASPKGRVLHSRTAHSRNSGVNLGTNEVNQSTTTNQDSFPRENQTGYSIPKKRQNVSTSNDAKFDSSSSLTGLTDTNSTPQKSLLMQRLKAHTQAAQHGSSDETPGIWNESKTVSSTNGIVKKRAECDLKTDQTSQHQPMKKYQSPAVSVLDKSSTPVRRQWNRQYNESSDTDSGIRTADESPLQEQSTLSRERQVVENRPLEGGFKSRLMRVDTNVSNTSTTAIAHGLDAINDLPPTSVTESIAKLTRRLSQVNTTGNPHDVHQNKIQVDAKRNFDINPEVNDKAECYKATRDAESPHLENEKKKTIIDRWKVRSSTTTVEKIDIEPSRYSRNTASPRVDISIKGVTDESSKYVKIVRDSDEDKLDNTSSSAPIERNESEANVIEESASKVPSDKKSVKDFWKVKTESVVRKAVATHSPFHGRLPSPLTNVQSYERSHAPPTIPFRETSIKKDHLYNSANTPTLPKGNGLSERECRHLLTSEEVIGFSAYSESTISSPYYGSGGIDHPCDPMGWNKEQSSLDLGALAAAQHIEDAETDVSICDFNANVPVFHEENENKITADSTGTDPDQYHDENENMITADSTGTDPDQYHDAIAESFSTVLVPMDYGVGDNSNDQDEILNPLTESNTSNDNGNDSHNVTSAIISKEHAASESIVDVKLDITEAEKVNKDCDIRTNDESTQSRNEKKEENNLPRSGDKTLNKGDVASKVKPRPNIFSLTQSSAKLSMVLHRNLANHSTGKKTSKAKEVPLIGSKFVSQKEIEKSRKDAEREIQNEENALDGCLGSSEKDEPSLPASNSDDMPLYSTKLQTYDYSERAFSEETLQENSNHCKGDTSFHEIGRSGNESVAIPSDCESRIEGSVTKRLSVSHSIQVPTEPRLIKSTQDSSVDEPTIQQEKRTSKKRIENTKFLSATKYGTQRKQSMNSEKKFIQPIATTIQDEVKTKENEERDIKFPAQTRPGNTFDKMNTSRKSKIDGAPTSINSSRNTKAEESSQCILSDSSTSLNDNSEHTPINPTRFLDKQCHSSLSEDRKKKNFVLLGKKHLIKQGKQASVSSSFDLQKKKEETIEIKTVAPPTTSVSLNEKLKTSSNTANKLKSQPEISSKSYVETASAHISPVLKTRTKVLPDETPVVPSKTNSSTQSFLSTLSTGDVKTKEAPTRDKLNTVARSGMKQFHFDPSQRIKLNKKAEMSRRLNPAVSNPKIISTSSKEPSKLHASVNKESSKKEHMRKPADVSRDDSSSRKTKPSRTVGGTKNAAMGTTKIASKIVVPQENEKLLKESNTTIDDKVAKLSNTSEEPSTQDQNLTKSEEHYVPTDRKKKGTTQQNLNRGTLTLNKFHSDFGNGVDPDGIYLLSKIGSPRKEKKPDGGMCESSTPQISTSLYNHVVESDETNEFAKENLSLEQGVSHNLSSVANISINDETFIPIANSAGVELEKSERTFVSNTEFAPLERKRQTLVAISAHDINSSNSKLSPKQQPAFTAETFLIVRAKESNIAISKPKTPSENIALKAVNAEDPSLMPVMNHRQFPSTKYAAVAMYARDHVSEKVKSKNHEEKSKNQIECNIGTSQSRNPLDASLGASTVKQQVMNHEALSDESQHRDIIEDHTNMNNSMDCIKDLYASSTLKQQELNHEALSEESQHKDIMKEHTKMNNSMDYIKDSYASDRDIDYNIPSRWMVKKNHFGGVDNYLPKSSHDIASTRVITDARLFKRYNTSSRFMDNDSFTGTTLAGLTSEGPSEFIQPSHSFASVESSFVTLDTTTSDSEILETPLEVKASSPVPEEVRRSPVHLVSDQFLAEKAANVAELESVCKHVTVKDLADDWVDEVNQVSADFRNFAVGINGKMAALRDYVGSKADATSESLLPKCQNLVPFDVEDVAIEVEYFDDGSQGGGVDDDNDDDPGDDFGMCTARVDQTLDQVDDALVKLRPNLACGLNRMKKKPTSAKINKSDKLKRTQCV